MVSFICLFLSQDQSTEKNLIPILSTLALASSKITSLQGMYNSWASMSGISSKLKMLLKW